MNVMKRFGTSLGLNLFNAQAGSGKTVPAGDGQGHWRTYNVTDGLAGGNVTSILQDRNGHLWFGAGGDGISRYDGQAWTTFTTEDGLGSNDVQSILQDREGHLWVGSLRSLSRYDGRVWEILKEILNTENSGLKVNSVRSIFQDREGNIWAGTPKGISRYDGRAWTTYTTEDGLAHNSIRTIFQDEMATSGLVLSAV
jgi:ligand-binding sensor domain-containing protein